MSKKSPSYISFSNVTFQYGDLPVLKNVNLSVQQNELALLMGPNGGGKTTLVKLLLGLLTPTKGNVTIEGAPVGKKVCSIGYVPQSLSFDPQFPLSVGEFLLMGALSKLKWYGKWPKEVKEQAHQFLELVGLKEFFYRPFASLSGGQRQRVTFMRALMSDPAILVLDEPINNLDVQSSDFFFRLIDENRGKRTMIVITHFLGEIFEKADSMYIVDGTVNYADKKHVCSHYPLGLYHSREEEENG